VVIDLHQGQQDIARRLVRTVGDPIQRFSEDGLRPMRAVRQATQLGFDVDAATLAAIPPPWTSFARSRPNGCATSFSSCCSRLALRAASN